MDVRCSFAEVLNFLLVDCEFRRPPGRLLQFTNAVQHLRTILSRFVLVDVLQADIVRGLRLHVWHSTWKRQFCMLCVELLNRVCNDPEWWGGSRELLCFRRS